MDYSNFNVVTGLQNTLKTIFSLGANENDELANCFKVLVFDDYVYEILCPLMKVQALRQENISFSLNIKSKKERIPDVMAIYLVQPSPQNFKLIKNDMINCCFDNYYFAFVDYCGENLMKDFFSILLETKQYKSVYKIEAHPIGLFSFHSQVFSFNIDSPYCLLNSGKVKDEQINNYLSQVGSGIFNVFYSLRTIPTIKYRQGWFAENVIKEIQTMLDYMLVKFPETKEKLHVRNDTLLVIIDRESDLPIMFHHSASLGALVHDLFGVTRGKNQKESDTKGKARPLELDPVDDFIWNKYCSQSYIEIVQNKIAEEFKLLTQQTDYLDIKNLNDPNRSQSELIKLSEKMSETMDNFAEIELKKRILKTYASFNTDIYSQISERGLGVFYQLEELMLVQRKGSVEIKKQFLELIKGESDKFKIKSDTEASQYDLMRLALIYYLTNSKLSSNELAEIESVLTKLNVNMNSLNYLKGKKEFEMAYNQNQQAQDSSNGYFKKGVSYLFNRIGGILQDGQPSIIADIVNNLSNGKDVTNYVEYNLLKKEKVQNKGTTYNKVIVFVCGGGNFVEYEALDTYLVSKGKTVRNIYIK